MELSIIIPCYNTADCITPMLTSLMNQETEHSYEVIFVLNNCTDNTEGVIRQSGIECTITECKEQGCGCARNKGLEIASGDYIWFIDSDDCILTPYAIDEILDTVQGRDICRIRWESNAFHRQYFSMVWQYCFKRELIGGTRFPSIQPREDDVFTQEILSKLNIKPKNFMDIRSTGNVLYYYLYGREGSNMTRYMNGEEI